MSTAGESVDIQLAVGDDDEPPQPQALRDWAGAALAATGRPEAGLTVRIVADDEARALNRDFRGRDYATNVLSFAFDEVPPEAMAELGGPYLGDIVICAGVVAREAHEQGKSAEQHWAHMVVHGVLHLLGHDHGEPAEAEAMEAHERAILARLGYPDPYAAADADQVPEGAR